MMHWRAMLKLFYVLILWTALQVHNAVHKPRPIVPKCSDASAWQNNTCLHGCSTSILARTSSKLFPLNSAGFLLLMFWALLCSHCLLTCLDRQTCDCFCNIVYPVGAERWSEESHRNASDVVWGLQETHLPTRGRIFLARYHNKNQSASQNKVSTGPKCPSHCFHLHSSFQIDDLKRPLSVVINWLTCWCY